MTAIAMLQSVRIRPHQTALALALLALSAAPARAGDCGDVDAMGQCRDAQTLAWCAEGKLKQATCPKGEICAPHQSFNGGVGCLPPDKTSCGTVPTEGQCTSAGAVAWCDDRGKVQVQSCGAESVCGWDSEHSWYDCLPMPPGPRAGLPDGGAAADAGYSDSADGNEGNAGQDASTDASTTPPEEIGPGSDTPGLDGPSGPTPGVAPGASKGEDTTSLGGACSGGRDGGPFGWLWAVLALMATAAMRARPTATRRAPYSLASSRSTVPRSPTA
ncbi:MAG: hypothetical protein R3F39_02370 [Myxococcota bacterium]